MKEERKRFLIYWGMSILLLVGVSSCMVGPKFEETQMEVPNNYRDTDNATADSLINLEWWDIFKDEDLQSLIKIAIEENRNAQIASSRIEEARQTLGMTKADQYPYIGFGANYGYGTQNFGAKGNPMHSFSILPEVSWEADIWGKLRHATAAARNEFLNSEFGYRSVMISLISDVADTYFTLLEYDYSLRISERTLKVRRESLELMQERFDKGTIAELDLNQAQMQEATAAAAVPRYRRLIAQTENALSILIGRNPGPIVRNIYLIDQLVPDEIPAGIPSDVLNRRPDVVQSYYSLRAQHERVGIATAQRLPSLTLTAGGGSANSSMTKVLSSGTWLWGVGGGLTGPIFNFGKHKRAVEVEKERTKQAELAYENNILVALEDVNNSLIAVKTYKDELIAIRAMVGAAENYRDLASQRYDAGYTSFLEVLDAERSLYDAQLQFSESLKNRLSSYVFLYKALGGGWLTPEEQEKGITDAQEAIDNDGVKLLNIKKK